MDASNHTKQSLPVEKVSRAASPQGQQAPALQPLTADLIQRAQADPHSLTPSDVQTLQRTVGNSAVARMLANRDARASAAPVMRPPIVQAKLKVGRSSDVFEQEANAIARQVVSQLHAGESASSLSMAASHPAKTSSPPRVSSVQRWTGAPVENAASAQGGELSPALTNEIQRARSGGQPLAAPVRSAMEQAFGADFAGVRIHQSARADTLNRSIHARAFTSEQDLFFRQGEYNPNTVAGQGLLAHELTHVVQQSGGQLQRAFSADNRAFSHSPEERLPSAQQVSESGQYLGQPPLVSQHAPQGRIHRCDEGDSSESDLRATGGSGSKETFLHPGMEGRDPAAAINSINSSGLTEEYKTRAVKLIKSPDLVSQAGYGICGITSMLRAILIHHPNVFATVTIQALADDTVVSPWREFFQKRAKDDQKEKELDYLVAQWLVRKGKGEGDDVSQDVLSRNGDNVLENTKTKKYGEVYKDQRAFGDTFKMKDWEGAGHFATTAGGINYLYSSLTNQKGFKISVKDFGKDYALAKSKAGSKGTISASIRGHEFYQAGGKPVDEGPKEEPKAKYRHWVMLDDVKEVTVKGGWFSSDKKYFKMKVWTYEDHYDAMVNEAIIGQYINNLVVM